MKKIKYVDCASLPCRLPEETARVVDELIKELPAECRKLKTKAVADSMMTEVNSRCDVSLVSTPAVDHEKECLMSAGCDLDTFRKNPIVLFQHDQSQPCGRAEWIKCDGDRGILAKTHYPERPDKLDGEWLPEKVWGLVQADILRGKSVTFLPTEMAEPSEEQKALGAEVVFSKSLLLEYSVVAIPCCPEALVQAVQKNLDLELLGIHRTGQRVKTRTKRVEKIDRTPELLKAIEKLRLDPAAIAERVLEALKNRGRI